MTAEPAEPPAAPLPAGSHQPAGWSPHYAAALFCITALILFGSLFPFHRADHKLAGSAVAHLLSTWRQWDKPVDFIDNILLYLPFGFLLVQTLPTRLRPATRIMLAALSGACMASCVELAQFYEPERVSTLGDVYVNCLGAGLGGVAAVLLGRDIEWPLLRELQAQPDAMLLLALFAGYRLYPYVPTEHFSKYRAAVLGLLLAPRLSVGGTIHLAIAWLAVAAIVDALYGARRWRWLFPLLAACEIGAHVLVVRATLQWTDIAAAVLAGIGWTMLPRDPRQHLAIVTLLFAGLLAALQLGGAGFAAARHAQPWLPFSGLPWRVPHLLIPGLCERLFVDGGLIWLLRRCGLALWIGTAVTCALLVAADLAQAGWPGHAFGLTDVVLAFAAGIALALLRCGRGDAVAGR